MTRKLFWDNPYQTILETMITAVDGSQVFLAETIFFPFSGGQESDVGTIDGEPVLEARKTGTDITYLVSKNHSLQTGQAVTVKIEWERRYRLMRLHFAAELVLELVYRMLDGIEKIGAHIAVDKARLDFNWPSSFAPLLPQVAAEAATLIDQDLPIVSAFSDRQKERRYWEVAGFAQVPCGGTHLKRTGEVGTVRLKRKNPGKGKERIEIYLLE